MGRVPWVLVVPLLVGVFAGCLETGREASAESAAPAWRSGYAFAYSRTGTVTGETVQDGTRQATQETLPPARYVLEILNTTLRLNGDLVYLAAAYVDESPGHLTYVDRSALSLWAIRQRDLVLVPAHLEPTCAPEAATGLCRLAPGPLTFSSPPVDPSIFFDGDLAGLSLRWEVTSRVLDPQQVEVPMGQFGAIPVETTYSLVNPDDAAAALRVAEVELRFTETTSYAESLDAIVQVHRHAEVTLRLAGASVAPRVHRTVDVVESLEGMSRNVAPERDLYGVLEVAQGLVPLANPMGPAYRPFQYGLFADDSAEFVNAATGDMVTYTARVGGLSGFPAGHTVRWRLMDAAGHLVADGAGARFTHAFTEPGAYTMQLAAFDSAGREVAFTQTRTAANYWLRQAAECPPAALEPYLASCPELSLPVRPGIVSLSVAAQPVSAAPEINCGTLVLRNLDGVEFQGVATPTDHRIHLTYFGGSTVSNGNWTLQWRQHRAMAENVHYYVLLHYDAEGALPPLPPASAPLPLVGPVPPHPSHPGEGSPNIPCSLMESA